MSEHRHHDHDGGVRHALRSFFGGHSHDAPHSIDSALEAHGEATRALRISLIVLTVTAVVQLGVVLVSGSVALLADTIHNFADALTAVPLGIAFSVGRRPPSKRYTSGYGRAEDLAGIFIVAVIALSSAIAAWEAVSRLAHPRPVSNRFRPKGWARSATSR